MGFIKVCCWNENLSLLESYLLQSSNHITMYLLLGIKIITND